MKPRPPSRPSRHIPSLISLSTLALLVAGGLLSTHLLAGPLDPPSGPIAPTHKTLTEIEPRIIINAANTPGDADSLFKITQPGSYYFIGNITGVAGRHGIEITANDVTLDFTGFALTGVGGSLGGITVTASVSNLTIRNGTVRGWGQAGIGSTNAKSCILENLQASNNAINGMLIGENATVRSCTARQNTGIGISAQGGSTITGCTASGNTTTGIAGSGFGCTIAECASETNGGIGIRANVNCVVRGCVSRENGGHGIEAGANCVIEGSTSEANADFASGIVAGAGCVLTGCTASGNSNFGIDAADGSTIRGCTASFNGVSGIRVNIGASVTDCTAFQNPSAGIATSRVCTVTNCTAYQNAVGIGTGDGCTILNCSVYQNSSNGVGTGFACTISNCTALENSSNGFNIASGSTITGCTARINDFDGIFCVTACVVRGNTCSSNGNGATIGAGIHVTGNDNRIEGNNCNNADLGLDVDAAGNIIIRNTCAGNGLNWTIAANNVCGPIINRIAPASAAINGDSAPDSTASTHPNANFTY